MATELLLQLFRHNHWANLLLLDVCEQVAGEGFRASVDGTYGALGPTLVHLTTAESSYVWRFDQGPDRYERDDDPMPSVAELRDVLDRTGRRLVELAEAMPDSAFVEYLVDGEPRRWPSWTVLGQAMDHAREHRSHIATILTQIGITPPDMDVWAYSEHLKDAGAWV